MGFRTFRRFRFRHSSSRQAWARASRAISASRRFRPLMKK